MIPSFLENAIIASTVSIVVLFIVITSAVVVLERFNNSNSISTSSESTKELQSIQIFENKSEDTAEVAVENVTEETKEVENLAENIVEETREDEIAVGTVCLTFDDGPSLEITPQILNILEEKGVNATFFVIGFDSNNDTEKVELLKREANDGDVIGLHGMIHNYSIYSDIDTLMNNFYQIENLVTNITGTNSKIIRFPGGTSNTISEKYCEGIMTQAVQRVTEEGYLYVDWNIDSGDASGNQVPAEEIYNNVVSNLKPGRVNVVLMHDGSTKQTTVDALSAIIDYCQANGYDIKALSTDMSIGSSQHHPKN